MGRSLPGIRQNNRMRVAYAYHSSNEGVNSVAWFPSPGRGLAYGTIVGHVCFLTPEFLDDDGS